MLKPWVSLTLYLLIQYLKVLIKTTRVFLNNDLLLLTNIFNANKPLINIYIVWSFTAILSAFRPYYIHLFSILFYFHNPVYYICQSCVVMIQSLCFITKTIHKKITIVHLKHPINTILTGRSLTEIFICALYTSRSSY